MPQENVEIVRRIYEQVSVHHRLPKDLFEPACATDWTEVSPDFGVRYGARAADEALASYFETFENFHVEAEAVLHADAERVVTVVRDGGRMKASDAEVWNRFFHAWTLRDGKVVRLSSHIDRERAFEAVGLRE